MRNNSVPLRPSRATLRHYVQVVMSLRPAMPRAKIGPDRPEWEKVLKTLGPKDSGTEGPRDQPTVPTLPDDPGYHQQP